MVGDTSDGAELLSLVQPLRAEVVLLDFNISGLDALSVCEQITTQHPFCAVIMTAHVGEASDLRAAMQAGASDFLLKPVSSVDLTQAVVRAADRVRARVRQMAPGEAEEGHRSLIASVYSPQGGVGKSLLAANLAVCLARESQRPTVLMDLNLQFGNLDLILNLTPERTIAAIIPRLNQLDADLMESFLTVHPDSGLKVLPAPSRPEYADTITVFVVEQVLRVLRERYAYIVVDTPSVLQDTTLTALDHSDRILLLTTLDLLALNNTKIALEMMKKLRYGEDKIQVVLNRSNSDVGISADDVERTLECKIAAYIPSDGRVAVTSVNEGEPFVISQPQTPIAQSIRKIAYQLMGREDEMPVEVEVIRRPEKRGFLKTLFGG